jgi:hypothetical protein
MLAVDDQARANAVLTDDAAVTSTALTSEGLRVTLSSDAAEHAAAAINRRLVEAGVAVHRLEPSRVSLEERFLEITSRLEDAA